MDRGVVCFFLVFCFVLFPSFVYPSDGLTWKIEGLMWCFSLLQKLMRLVYSN